MFEFELWRLRQQLARINQTTERTQGHMDAIEAMNRREAEKIERACEEGKRLFEPQRAAAPPAPPVPPLSPHALSKARTLAGLRGTSAPPAPTVPPNPAFVELKEETLAGLRGGR